MLNEMEPNELNELEDLIDSVQRDRAEEDPIDFERRKVIAGIRQGLLDWSKSTTLMDFLGK